MNFITKGLKKDKREIVVDSSTQEANWMQALMLTWDKQRWKTSKNCFHCYLNQNQKGIHMCMPYQQEANSDYTK